MQTVLKLKETLTDKEIKKFKLTNELKLTNFYGYQYSMCIGGIQRNNTGQFVFNPEYSSSYINTKVTPSQFISFCELHKNIITKEKCYSSGGRFVTLYYLNYVRDDRPNMINGFSVHSRNRSLIEIIISEGNYYRPIELRLELDNYTSILNAIHSLFSNENLSVLSCISKSEDGQYKIEYYDDYGKTKVFRYPNIESIYHNIISVKLLENERL